MAKPLSPRGHDRQRLGAIAQPHAPFTSPACEGEPAPDAFRGRRAKRVGRGHNRRLSAFPLPIPPPQAGEGGVCRPLTCKRRDPDGTSRVNEPQKPWLARLSAGLKRTASAIGGAISDLVQKRPLDAATIEELEDVLIRADLGVAVAGRIAAAVAEGRYDKSVSPEEVRRILAAEVEKVLGPVAKPLEIKPAKPFVILVVGVNGSGKTTTIGKLAEKFRREGRRVMLAAGD